MRNQNEYLPVNPNQDNDYQVMPYHDSEMPLTPYNKQYFGLAGIFSSTLGYPTEQLNYISLTTMQGHTLDFEVCLPAFQTLKQTADATHLSQSESLWLWVSVDSLHGLEDWRIFKTHLPHSLIQTLYDHAQHIDSLFNLLQLIQGFKTQAIKEFAESLLHNDCLMKIWFSIPASKQHHHSFPGGLMVHSLEVAQMVKHNLSLIESELRNAEQDITILTALLHDIGKTETLALKQHTDLGRLVDHEKLTLLVLAEPLSRLATKWPKAAETLKYLLTWKTADGFCKFIGGEVIKNADQISTKLSLRRMAFEGKPDYFQYSVYSASGRNYYLNRL